jgi:hypothetical protein
MATLDKLRKVQQKFALRFLMMSFPGMSVAAMQAFNTECVKRRASILGTLCAKQDPAFECPEALYDPEVSLHDLEAILHDLEARLEGLSEETPLTGQGKKQFDEWVKWLTSRDPGGKYSELLRTPSRRERALRNGGGFRIVIVQSDGPGAKHCALDAVAIKRMFDGVQATPRPGYLSDLVRQIEAAEIVNTPGAAEARVAIGAANAVIFTSPHCGSAHRLCEMPNPPRVFVLVRNGDSLPDHDHFTIPEELARDGRLIELFRSQNGGAP